MVYDSSCIFCRIVKGEIKSERVGESNSFIAIRDAKPKTDGHTLIISREHFMNLMDMPNELGEELMSFTKKVASGLIEKKLGEGFNVLMNNSGCAGQLVMHAHLHIIPRKDGDGIRFFTRG